MGRKNTAATAATAAPAATPAAAPAAAPAATPAATPAAAPAATPAAAPAATPAAAPAATPAAEAAAEKSSALARMHVIWPHGLNLRDGPGVDFAVIGVLPCGFNVETDPDLAQEVGDDVWVPVQAGWVNRAFLSPAETEP